MTEIKNIKERQKQLFFSGYYQKYDSDVVKDDVDLIYGDRADLYLYPDINYEDDNRSIWRAGFHYYRMELQIIKSGRERIDDDPLWRDKMLGAIRFWVENDFKNSNWWQNQIGMPQTMVNLAIAFEDYLTDDLIFGLKKLISRGTFRANEGINEIIDLVGFGKSSTADAWTGANLVWGAATTIKFALWLEDEDLLRWAVKRLAKEIKFSREGIQEDGAFCQHGPRWYSGGYGRSFVYELAPIINVLRETSFALPSEKIDMILMHILDGQRMMMKNGFFDFGAVGREYARPGALEAGTLKKALPLIIADESLARHEELVSFYNDIASSEDKFEGTEYYSSIAQLCHKKNGMYFGIRGRTEGVFGSESCNSEGILSYNMSYGTVTCVMERGQEYFDISPFWDYSKIPGTTARGESDEELLLHEGWSSTLETPCRAYGKSDGDCGVLCEDAVHDGISLTASYFVFNGAMVALGTDIKDKTPEKGELFTTVDQCFSHYTECGENFAKNGNVIYKNLDKNTHFCSRVYRQKGKWSRNNLNLSTESIYEDMFSVTIPVTEYGKYAYLISSEKAPEVEVIRNESDCQAIIIGGDRVMAVFHNDCSLMVGNRMIKGKKGEIVLR